MRVLRAIPKKMILIFSPELFYGLSPLEHLQVSFSTVSTDASFLSSIAIILGAIFVVFQIRNDGEALRATKIQASASADQARLSTEQLKQNNNLATMNLVLAVYDFANSLEVQRSWRTILKTKIETLEEFEKLPDEVQLAFQQMASLFESIGLMVERGFAQADLIDDMFATETAWNALKPFVLGMRQKYPGEEYYSFFEKLYKRLKNI